MMKGLFLFFLLFGVWNQVLGFGEDIQEKEVEQEIETLHLKQNEITKEEEKEKENEEKEEKEEEELFVWWFAPFFSGGGYSSEAITLALSLEPLVSGLKISQHGDSFDSKVVGSMDSEKRNALLRLSHVDFFEFFSRSEERGIYEEFSLRWEFKMNLNTLDYSIPNISEHSRVKLVIVCHSEPGAWTPPMYHTTSCPPPTLTSTDNMDVYVIGRTMFETDRIPDGWPSRCENMDQIWVPSSFHLKTFHDSGVPLSLLRTVPESVNVTFYDPKTVKPLDLSLFSSPVTGLPLSVSVNGVEEDEEKNLDSEEENLGEMNGHDDPDLEKTSLNFEEERVQEEDFIFLSIFKWEERKGWPILLRAFLSEFSPEENVQLVIRTSAFHSASDFENQIQEFIQEDPYLREIHDSSFGNEEIEASCPQQAESCASEVPTTLEDEIGNEETKLENKLSLEKFPTISLIDTHLSDHDLVRMYKTSDAFVLPTRGEGWGRPQAEAMAMGLPVLTTNWSGTLEFINNENSFPISLSEEEPLVHPQNGPFESHLWANPSLESLRSQMRYVFENREEAKKRGAQARLDMEVLWSPEAVAQNLLQTLKDLIRTEPTIRVKSHATNSKE